MVVYRIEPENVPFDVTPFSGDVFSRYGVPNGRYFFDVIATDSRAQVSWKWILQGLLFQKVYSLFYYVNRILITLHFTET